MYLSPEKRYGKVFYEYADSFRLIGIDVDQGKDVRNYVNVKSAINFLVSDIGSTTLERTKYLEALSYGDAGVLLSSPGPSLSGLFIRELGTKKQIDEFYTSLASEKIRTFFALTEREKGSDANNITSRLKQMSDNEYYLSGEKCFFGNGGIGEMGVVIAKIGDTAAGFRAVWLKQSHLSDSSVYRQSLNTFSLKGAHLGYLSFRDLPIDGSLILGWHKLPMQRGMSAIIKVFNRLRPGVGAIAIGQAQAICDFMLELSGKQLLSYYGEICRLQDMINIARSLLWSAAKQVDLDPFATSAVSMAKLKAISIAKDVMLFAKDRLPIDVLMENAWVMKAIRDMYCWEYMEGTSHILREHVKGDLKNYFSQPSVR